MHLHVWWLLVTNIRLYIYIFQIVFKIFSKLKIQFKKKKKRRGKKTHKKKRCLVRAYISCHDEDIKLGPCHILQTFRPDFKVPVYELDQVFVDVPFEACYCLASSLVLDLPCKI